MLEKFLKVTKPKGTAETKDDTYEEEQQTTKGKTTRTIPFLTLCAEMSLKPRDPSTTKELQDYCDAGMMVRHKLPRNQLKVLEKSNMPEAAMYEYEVSEKQVDVSNSKRDKSSYKARQSQNIPIHLVHCLLKIKTTSASWA